MEKEQALAHSIDISVTVDVNILVRDDNIVVDRRAQDDNDDDVCHVVYSVMR